MADLFDALDGPTAANEGGYVNNPNDRGGETNHGITVAVARANGYTGPMRAMSAGQAKAIRRSEYYIKPNIDQIAALSNPVAMEVYDTGINMGVHTAGVFFQRCLNALNRQGKDYADIKVDGQIGPATVNAFKAYRNRNMSTGTAVMIKALNCLQGARYIEISEARGQNEEFTNGWMATRIGLWG